MFNSVGGGKKNHQGGKVSIASANLGKNHPMTAADQEMTGETTGVMIVATVVVDTPEGTRYRPGEVKLYNNSLDST